MFQMSPAVRNLLARLRLTSEPEAPESAADHLVTEPFGGTPFGGADQAEPAGPTRPAEPTGPAEAPETERARPKRAGIHRPSGRWFVGGGSASAAPGDGLASRGKPLRRPWVGDRFAVLPAWARLPSSDSWPIRAKIIALLIVPLLALAFLWFFATATSVGPALDLRAALRYDEAVGQPAESLAAELRVERRLSLAMLGGESTAEADLSDQRDRVDVAAAAFRTAANDVKLPTAGREAAVPRLAAALSALAGLRADRESVDRRRLHPAEAMSLYTDLIAGIDRLRPPLASVDDPGLIRLSQTAALLDRAREVLSQTDAVVTGVIASGRMSTADQRTLVSLIGTRRFLYADAAARLLPEEQARYELAKQGAAMTRLSLAEDRLSTVTPGSGGTADPAAPPLKATEWRAAYDGAAAELRQIEAAVAAAPAARAAEIADGALTRVIVAGVLSLLAVILSVLISVRIGRSLIRRLGGLRRSALELASVRLPSVITRLRGGEQVDVASEAPLMHYGDDEIGHLGDAFNEVQRTAVRSAVQEARLRTGLDEVFVNIARRSQTLLHRQLDLLDQMERRSTDPEELEALFRVDHLATRMRRNAEDLVILAGAAQGRGWRTPIPLVDVIRGAVSEVEDYARVTIQEVSDAAIVGRAVGDIIHLLSELIENATSFSPPRTQVNVSAQVVPNGCALDIEDRGLGMTEADLEAANRRLAAPPEFDPATSERLGLYVVAKLAARNGIRVRLRASPYGGVTAVVLVPPALLASDRVELEMGSDSPLRRRRYPLPVPVAPAQRTAIGAAPPTPPDIVPADRPAEKSDAEPVAPPPLKLIATATATATAAANAVAGVDGTATNDRKPDGKTKRPAGPDIKLQRRRTATADETALPKRVRQANLAPELRDGPPPTLDGVDDAPAVRSPEQIRAMMAAFQAGMDRGRQAADEWVPDTPRDPQQVGSDHSGDATPERGE
jgi:signal transduction histidine kinase